MTATLTSRRTRLSIFIYELRSASTLIIRTLWLARYLKPGPDPKRRRQSRAEKGAKQPETESYCHPSPRPSWSVLQRSAATEAWSRACSCVDLEPSNLTEISEARGSDHTAMSADSQAHSEDDYMCRACGRPRPHAMLQYRLACGTTAIIVSHSSLLCFARHTLADAWSR